MLDEAQIERVLVITAHPDDVDFGAAGTVAGLTDRGVHVTYCIVTDGDAGGFEIAVSRAEMATLRREEQTRAAKEVGVDDLVFLAQPDGRLQADLGLRELLARVIRQVRPQLVITQHPVRNLNRIRASHPDHLAVGEAALCAVFPDSRNPFAFPHLLQAEGLEPWTVPEVWLFGGGDGARVVDITDQLDRKLPRPAGPREPARGPGPDRLVRGRVGPDHRSPVRARRRAGRRGLPRRGHGVARAARGRRAR